MMNKHCVPILRRTIRARQLSLPSAVIGALLQHSSSSPLQPLRYHHHHHRHYHHNPSAHTVSRTTASSSEDIATDDNSSSNKNQPLTALRELFSTAQFKSLSSQFIMWAESITAEDVNSAQLYSILDDTKELLPSIMEPPMSLERRVLRLYFSLVLHHHTTVGADAGGDGGGDAISEIPQRQSDRQLLIDSRWIDTHLQKVISAALALQRMRNEDGKEESASGSEVVKAETDGGEALLDVDLVFMLTAFVQKVVSVTAHRTRKSRLMHSWIDLLLFRPQHDMIQDEQLRRAIMRIRGDLLQERNDGSKILHATKLCAMAVDAMLRGNYNNPRVAIDVLNLINKIITSEPANKEQMVRVHNHLLVTVIQKCNPVSPEDKWKLFQVSLKRDGGEPSHQTLHELLIQCREKKDRITTNKIIEYVIQDPSLLQNPKTMRSILNAMEHSVSPARALNFWESLSEDLPSKWHGFVLYEVLYIAMSAKQHNYWNDRVRDILQRADDLHGGSWPTPFFYTITMQNGFEKLSRFMHELLMKFGEKHNSDEHVELAKRWNVFAKDQVRRFEPFVHESKRSRVAQWKAMSRKKG